MENQQKLESVINAAKAGDESAEAEFFSKLAVRFLPLATRKLRGYPVLVRRINLDEAACEVCQHAVDEVKKLSPPGSPKWSLMRADRILANVLDDFIANSLTDLAKNSDPGAENLLLRFIRNKLMERIIRKRWRIFQDECEDN